jgi:hypothetical protein
LQQRDPQPNEETENFLTGIHFNLLFSESLCKLIPDWGRIEA